MKKFLLTLILILVLFFSTGSVSSATIVHVVDTFYTQDGSTPATGSIQLTWPNFYGSDGHLIVASSLVYTLVSGVFTADLESTTDSTPLCKSGTVGCAVYTATYSIVGQTPRQREYWSVPPLGGSVPIKSLRILNPGPNGPLVPNVFFANLPAIVTPDAITCASGAGAVKDCTGAATIPGFTVPKNNTTAPVVLNYPDSTSVTWDSQPLGALQVLPPATPSTRNYLTGIYVQTSSTIVRLPPLL